MRRRIDARLKPPPPEANTVVAKGAQAGAPTTPAAFDERGELEQVNVLYSFVEDRYMKRVGFFGVGGVGACFLPVRLSPLRYVALRSSG